MTVHERFMAVLVRVRLPHRHAVMFMFMMGIMSVPMIVRCCHFVNMFVPVLLSHV